MIVYDRTVGVNVKFFTKSHKEFEELYSAIRQDFITVIQHYADELETSQKEHPKNAIHLMQDSRCPSCGKVVTQCQCGKPHRSPAV